GFAGGSAVGELALELVVGDVRVVERGDPRRRRDEQGQDGERKELGHLEVLSRLDGLPTTSDRCRLVNLPESMDSWKLELSPTRQPEHALRDDVALHFRRAGVDRRRA